MGLLFLEAPASQFLLTFCMTNLGTNIRTTEIALPSIMLGVANRKQEGQFATPMKLSKEWRWDR